MLNVQLNENFYAKNEIRNRIFLVIFVNINAISMFQTEYMHSILKRI